MCGVVGYINYDSQVSCNINRMLESISHRGPDAQDFKKICLGDLEVVLGHVRLSILDLSSNANQPMSDQTDDYHIVYNGEVYNFEEIRLELENKYEFKTKSDTEVILYSYIEWGMDCVKKFVGMFSIVICDLMNETLVFINDRLGVKPLYIYHDDDILVFSSELKGILQCEGIDKTVDRKALTQFMQYGYIQPPLSIFKKVTKIEPGTILTYNLSKKIMRKERYWQVDDLIDSNNKTDDYMSELKITIKKACDYRMVSDVPVCAFLSSGIDSSLVTAILSKNHKLGTITVGVDDSKYDEAVLSKRIASNLKTEHTETYINKDNLLDLVEKLPYYYDEPFSDTSIYPTYIVSKLARRNYKVALSSDGGDEAFGGYYRYLYFKRSYSFLSKLPGIVKMMLSKLIFFLWKSGAFNFVNIQMLSLKVKKALNSLESKCMSDFYENLNKYISDKRVKSILVDAEIDNGYFKEFNSIKKKTHDDILNTAMLIDYKTYIYQILTKVDRASMANSLEVREPLLDHNFISVAANVNSEEKINNNQTKIPMRKMLSDYLDVDLLSKNKKGFSIPIEDWLRSDLRNLVDKLTTKSAVDSSGVFNYSEVKKIKNRFYSSRDDYIELWHIVIFQLWYSRWVEEIK